MIHPPHRRSEGNSTEAPQYAAYFPASKARKGRNRCERDNRRFVGAHSWVKLRRSSRVGVTHL